MSLARLLATQGHPPPVEVPFQKMLSAAKDLSKSYSCMRANYATKVATHHAKNSYIRPTDGCRRLRPYTHWCL